MPIDPPRRPGATSFVARHAELFSIAATALLIAVVEIVLLNVKYEAFRGGFLQSHQIKAPLDRAAFLAGVVALHLLSFGALGAAWFRLARRLGVPRAVRMFDWIVVSLVVSGLFTIVRYQIHSYFGDFLTFSIAKSLGGGSIADAVRYVANEAALAVIAIGAVVAFYIFVRRRIARRAAADIAHEFHTPGVRTMVIGALGAVLVMVLVGQSELMWYHMRRTNLHFALDRMLDGATDFDRDGYGLISFPKDPAAVDASVYPGALDLPGNGIDEDGFLGDFVFRPRPQRQVLPAGGRHPNIVIVVLESMRAEALHATAANGRPAMPFLASLAAGGTESAGYYSHTGYTTSSVKSIFAGSVGESAPPLLLPPLKRAGFDIHVVSGQDEHFGEMAKAAGSDQLANTFFDAKSAPERRVFASSASGSLTLSNSDVAEQFAAVAGQSDWARPQFFYLNLQSAHFPYYHDGMPKLLSDQVLARSQIRAEQAAALRETYLNACANDDAALKKIVDTLRARGAWDNTLLVVVGDHGESLFDDGYLGHGFIISRTQLNTVFVSNRRFATPAAFGHADLAPLVLAQAGFRIEPESRPAPGVFHYLGTLDRPSMIGMTLPDQSMLSFDPSTRRVTVARPGAAAPWVGSHPLPADSPHAATLRDAIMEWEHLRWEAQLRKAPAAPAAPASAPG
jgi:phosphoglycerol transferase MdoB-like AlkP superfamily enzyme